MRKVLFFGIAAFSVHKSLLPILDELASNNYKVVYYNVEYLKPDSISQVEFIPYPEEFTGHYANKVGVDTSYFEFGEILLDMTSQLIDFLIAEVEREEPDLIIHSHLAIWGKFIAKYFNLNRITFFTTFIMDKRIILPYFKKLSEEKNVPAIDNITSALRFNRKCKSLNLRLGLNEQIDFWDTLVNSGQLNLSFILKCLQPKPTVLDPNFKFLGYPMPILDTDERQKERKIIYVSMGTLTKTELSLFHTFIDTLKEFKIKCIISLGSKMDVNDFKDVSENIEIRQFVDQREVLKETLLFISQGGMASVHESIYSITPMIVIPMIPEQQITADRIQDLNIGKHLPLNKLSKEVLKSAIETMLLNRSTYVQSIIKVSNSRPSKAPQTLALNAINDFLKISDVKKKAKTTVK